MAIEALPFIVLFCIALAPILAVLGRARIGPRTKIGAMVALWLGLAHLIVTTVFLWTDRPASGEGSVSNRPIQRPADDYVGSAECRSCHPHNHATWHDSYHRTMTQVASEKSVIGNFDNVRLQGNDFNVRLFKQDKQFLAELKMRNPDNAGVFPVVMTTGSHNRQAYWLASSPNSRDIMILPYMFLRDEQRWIPRHSAYINSMCLQDRPERAVLKADFARWSQVCIECHATHGRPFPATPRNDRSSHLSAPQAAEFGISCEACHGPGAEHVRVNRDPIRRYRQHLGDDSDPTIVNPARLPHDRSSQVCGRCHSSFIHRSEEASRKWSREGHTFRPGDDLMKDPILFIMRGRPDLLPKDRPSDCPDPSEMGSFWSDGMIRATGREFNGLLDSPCYQRGEMSCLSCHVMHQPSGENRPRSEWARFQVKLGMDGNSACIQCHDRFNQADRVTQHTHHAADSPGSICYNCHMSYTTYGLLRAARSHQISSPNVRVSQQSGRPNACNQCHLDKTLDWTGDKLSQWYNIPKPEMSRDERQIAATVLWALRGDAGQRALMAWSYGWEDALKASGNHWQAPFLAQLLEDRYDAVRFIAHRSLKRLPGFKEFDYDFVGHPEQRSEAHLRALKNWEGSRRPESLPRSVLIDDHGHLIDAEFQRLLKQRDDRPVTVNE